MKVTLIPPGEFMMGSPQEVIDEERKRPKTNAQDWYLNNVPLEGPQHRVRITRPYWLGTTVVTQEEYQRVIGSNPSKYQDPKRPAERVSWDDAVEFCRKLSELPAEEAANRVYSLPTEAQWEYACRAGTTTRWYSGDDEAGLLDVAWFIKNAGDTTHPVAEKKPNAWGLYDMYGNVWQWCQDLSRLVPYSNAAADDPAGPFRWHGPRDARRVPGTARRGLAGRRSAMPSCPVKGATTAFASSARLTIRPDDRRPITGPRARPQIPWRSRIFSKQCRAVGSQCSRRKKTWTSSRLDPVPTLLGLCSRREPSSSTTAFLNRAVRFFGFLRSRVLCKASAPR